LPLVPTGPSLFSGYRPGGSLTALEVRRARPLSFTMPANPASALSNAGATFADGS